MEDTKNEFQQDRDLDPTKLDIEAVKVSGTYGKWAERVAVSRKAVDDAKLHLDTVEAKLQLSCRGKPEKYGITKMTDAAVLAVVKTHHRYLGAYQRYITAMYEMRMMDAAARSIEKKEAMIKELVKLYGLQYFSGPSVPRDLLAAWQEERNRKESDVRGRQVGATRKRRRRERTDD